MPSNVSLMLEILSGFHPNQLVYMRALLSLDLLWISFSWGCSSGPVLSPSALEGSLGFLVIVVKHIALFFD